MKFIILLLTLIPTIGQAAECEKFARDVLAIALHQPNTSNLKVIAVSTMNVENVAANSVEKVERLAFSYGDGASITVDTLPSYYKGGVCELSALKISRE